MAVHIAFVQMKGGSGKTALVREVGAYLASQGKRVLAVDLDSNHSLSKHAGVGKGLSKIEYGIFAGMLGENDRVVQKSERVGFDVIVGGPNAEEYNKVELAEVGNVDVVLRMVEGLDEDYDFVFYDVRGGAQFWMDNAISAAHLVVAPVEGLDAVVNAEEVRERVPEGVDFAIVTLRMPEAENLFGDVYFELDAMGLLEFVIGHVRRSTDVARAPMNGPVVLNKSGAAVAVDLMNLGDWFSKYEAERVVA